MGLCKGSAPVSMVNQRGAAIQKLLNIILLLVVAFLVIKLYGPYYDNWKITKLFENLATELPAKPHTEKDIEKRIKRQFEMVDYITGINIKESLVYKKKKGKVKVDFTFDKRVPFIGNLDLVGRFSHHLEYAAPGRK